MFSAQPRNRASSIENKLIRGASKFVILFHAHPTVHYASSHMNKADDLVNWPSVARKGQITRRFEGRILIPREATF